MRKYLFISFFCCFSLTTLAQVTAPAINCSTVFFTVNVKGQIQQWSLLGDTVVGGDVVLNNCGRSIAYCGENNSQFYAVNPQKNGVIFQNSDTSWANLYGDIKLVNGGGHLNDIFFMGNEGGKNNVLFYFNGKSLEVVERFEDQIISSADVAVDNQGQAWIFIGDDLSNNTHIKVYSRKGLVKSYNLTMNSKHIYGSFFLNDVLYLGMGARGLNPNTITPVLIKGDKVELGSPVNFDGTNMHDMASCNNGEDNSTSDIKKMLDHNISIYPNPTTGHVNVVSDEEILLIEMYDANGKKLLDARNQTSIDLNNEASGQYYIRVHTASGKYNKTVIKID
ncbi:MAG: T9SS type A sorting domain-containing protein [Bacteroidia bacterium]|nr:T9SS type A sorting domain-containing protein [Bacteroidia bacterium]